MPREMTPEEIRAFLSHGTRTAKVATSGPGGQPHVMPVWFALDGEELVFTTWGDSVKGRNLRRNLRAAIVVDDEVAPYAFVHVRGHVTLSEDLEELLRFATAIGGRYMGVDRAEEFGRRNAVAGRAAGAAPSGACDRESGRRWLVRRHATLKRIVRRLKPSAENFPAAAAVYAPDLMLQLARPRPTRTPTSGPSDMLRRSQLNAWSWPRS